VRFAIVTIIGDLAGMRLAAWRAADTAAENQDLVVGPARPFGLLPVRILQPQNYGLSMNANTCDTADSLQRSAPLGNCDPVTDGDLTGPHLYRGILYRPIADQVRPGRTFDAMNVVRSSSDKGSTTVAAKRM
jgi:hypothetical protein